MNADLMNNFIRVKYYEIDYTRLEQIIKENFSVRADWSFVATEEMHNDSEKSFMVSSIEFDYKLYDVNSCYIVSNMLDDLCYRGLIKSGNYIVNVCW